MIGAGRLPSLLAALVVMLASISLVPVNYSATWEEPVIVTTDREAYVAGDAVQVNVSVVGPLSASFSSACQSFFVVENASGEVVYDLRKHWYWAQIPTYLGAPPTVNFHYTWDQKDDNGEDVPVPGDYTIWGFVAGYNQGDPPVAGDSTLISIGEETASESELVAGWNFISLPLARCDYFASNLGLAFGDAIFGWDSSAQSYDGAYVVGISPESADFALEPSVGYWIHSSTARSLVISGTAPPSTQHVQCAVPAQGGWVALGFLGFNSTRRASDVPAMYSEPGGIMAVVAYDAGLYEPFYVFDLSTDFELTVGQAYWVFCSASGVLTYAV